MPRLEAGSAEEDCKARAKAMAKAIAEPTAKRAAQLNTPPTHLQQGEESRGEKEERKRRVEELKNLLLFPLKRKMTAERNSQPALIANKLIPVSPPDRGTPKKTSDPISFPP